MSELISESDLEFDGELLIPRINLAAYRQIYALEGWLRRICLTAWMGRYGESWTQHLDPGVRKTLESRVKRSRQRLYLGAESCDDLIWQATHAELIRLITAESVAALILSLTGVDSEFVRNKLDEIREIRNVLAHNRALSQRTHIILSGLLASLEEAVDTFKFNILYRNPDPGSYGGLLTGERKPFQGFIAQCGEFMEFVCLPPKPFGKWPDARLLQQSFREHLNKIVAFCLNKTGDEFIVLSPMVLPDESQNPLYETFVQNQDVWTDVPFEKQQPRFICSPKDVVLRKSITPSKADS